MCGIFATVNAKGVASQQVLEGLKKLEYRGYDSWGIVVKTNKRQTIEVEKHVGKIGQAETHLPASNIGLGHTRWATHGGVTNANAHPHLDCTGTIAVVHNGIIENFRMLKSKLTKQGHTFHSDTDTEIVAHLVEEEKKNVNFTEAVFKAFSQLQGSNAIAVLDNDSEKIVACRDGSPLVLGAGKKQTFLASDVSALLKHTNQVLFIEDGQGLVIDSDHFDLYDLLTGEKIKAKIETIDWDEAQADKQNYPHYLLKEIFEQKEIIPKLVDLNLDKLKKVGKKLEKIKQVYLIGCGTAYHVALLARYYFANQGIVAHAVQAHEFEAFANYIDKQTMVVAISQSGETADTIIASKEAKKRGAYLLSLINAKGSTLERLSDINLEVGAGPEIAVVSTKASTAQLINLYLLANAKKQLKQAQKKVKQFAHKLNDWLTPALKEQILKLAKEIMDEQHAYIIGKKNNYPAALEFALKIKETSYLHAEGFASSELKHGVISLISQGTPCFVLTDAETETEVTSSAIEVKSRGGKIIGVGPNDSESWDVWLQSPEAGALTSIGNIIVGQMLGYLIGVGKGVDPDKPRNLAKSVTVK